MQSFIETGSLGSVTARIVSAKPPGIVRSVKAVPQVSRLSRHFGEQLKGIAVSVQLKHGAAAPKIVLDLRQVCARYFRSTFLYY